MTTPNPSSANNHFLSPGSIQAMKLGALPMQQLADAVNWCNSASYTPPKCDPWVDLSQSAATTVSLPSVESESQPPAIQPTPIVEAVIASPEPRTVDSEADADAAMAAQQAAEIAAQQAKEKSEKVLAEKQAQEKAEKEQAEKEKAEREKLAKEQAEKANAEKELAEKERAEKELIERERAERQKAEQENAEREQTERKAADLAAQKAKELAEAQTLAEKARADELAGQQKANEQAERERQEAIQREAAKAAELAAAEQKAAEQESAKLEKAHQEAVAQREAAKREADLNAKQALENAAGRIAAKSPLGSPSAIASPKQPLPERKREISPLISANSHRNTAPAESEEYLAQLERLVLELNMELARRNNEQQPIDPIEQLTQRIIELNLENLALREQLELQKQS